MHSLPNFAVLEGESRHKSSAKQQQSAMFVSDILEKLSLSPRSAHQSPLSVNHQIITSFTQRRSFLNSCYHLNLKHKSEEFGLFIVYCLLFCLPKIIQIK